VQEGFNSIDCAAGWGEPNCNWEGWECSSFDSYCELLPVRVDHWLPEVTPDFFPIPMCQDGWGRRAAEEFFMHTSKLAFHPVGLSTWYRQLFSAFEVSVGTELQDALFQPHLLIRLGYRLAQKAAQKHGVNSLMFQGALSAVGVGCRGLVPWVCTHCFRRPRGQLDLCDLHSQSKLVLDLADTERSFQFQRARATRKAARGIDPNTLPKRQFNGYWERDHYEFELQVGGILWSLTGDTHRDWLDHVMRALATAPLVSSRLSESFIEEQYHVQIAQLQQAVGSCEWLASRWPILIPLAETWLSAEMKAAPGATTQGLGEINRRRVALAQELLSKNVKHSQIAEQLGITRSHLSHLLRRAECKPLM
jgi:hypothetical protein